MTLESIKVGMTVFSGSGKAYKVLEVDKKQRFPVLVQSLTNGTTGRFSPSSLHIQKAVS
jgi:hypothetical protein